MAGYSGTPLWKKLGIKPGHTLLFIGVPAEVLRLLPGLPEGVTFTDWRRKDCAADVLLVTVPNAAALAKWFPVARRCMKPDSGLWLSWPKKSSGVKTDLTENIIRDVALAAGLVDNKVCAIDETWSGLRVVVRVRDRPGRSC